MKRKPFREILAELGDRYIVKLTYKPILQKNPRVITGCYLKSSDPNTFKLRRHDNGKVWSVGRLFIVDTEPIRRAM